MHFTIIIALSVASIATALPAALRTRQSSPTSDQVEWAISQWINDVENVNNFLNVATTLQDPTGAAADTKQTSLNEPFQLGILASIPNLDDASLGAVNLLMEIFGNVPTDLQSIVDDPSSDNVATQVHSIDNVRCLDVLPALDTLWAGAATAVGLPTPPLADREDACSNLNG